MSRQIKFLRQNWVISLILCFYAYLAVHALSGNQGLMKWVDYKDDIHQSRQKLERLQGERLDLQSRSSQLSASALDLESLDVKSREKLFVSHPNDYIIFLDPKP